MNVALCIESPRGLKSDPSEKQASFLHSVERGLKDHHLEAQRTLIKGIHAKESEGTSHPISSHRCVPVHMCELVLVRVINSQTSRIQPS